MATPETSMLEDLKHLSARKKFQVVQAVGRVLGKLSELGWNLTCGRESEFTQRVPLLEQSGEPGSVPDIEGQKKVKFSDLEEARRN